MESSRLAFSRSDLQGLLDQLRFDNHEAVRGWGRKNWTSLIKNAFAGAGKQAGYYVCAAGAAPCDWGEWLFDVTWLEVDEDKYITDIVLAMESEWGNPGDVYDDFVKLLASRARMRVIVFQAATDANLQKIIDDLANGVRRFNRHPDGGITLWGCYISSQGRFVTGELLT